MNKNPARSVVIQRFNGSTLQRPLRHAFTLMELLVVIAIIGIVAGLLMPALAKAKAKAHQTGCFNNQRQIGLAIPLFENDHGDGVPWAYGVDPDIGGAVGTYFTHDIWEYVMSKPFDLASIFRPGHTFMPVLLCPGHKSLFQGDAVTTFLNSYAGPAVGNCQAGGVPYSGFYPTVSAPVLIQYAQGPYVRRKSTQIDKPSDVAPLTEMAADSGRQLFFGQLNSPWAQVDPFSNGVQSGTNVTHNYTLQVHGGRVNYTFMDGHVESPWWNDSRVLGTGTTNGAKGIWTINPND